MLRILHLEDSSDDGELVRELLKKDGINCEFVRHETHPAFLRDLIKGDFDLIFADSAVPGFSGRQALELSRQHAPHIPFIFVSGTIGEEAAIEALHEGATDYVLKHRLGRLVPAVRRALAEKEQRTKNEEMEQRLRQAQRLEAIGTLAGGVAHDFNNILTIIKGHASLIPMECDRPDRVQESAAIIDRAAGRGAELAKQLLAFARKSDGSFTLTDLNQRVREITGMLREAFPKNILFELKLEEDMPGILADPGQVERVLINLATNARDALPQGGTIHFSTWRVHEDSLPDDFAGERDRPYLCLEVRDDGIGMDEATRQHIFEPFFTTKPKGEGTGLGMPVVYGLMQSHHGFIDVKSAPGQGTAVSLFFPIPEADVAEPEHPVAKAPHAVEGTETILIVDDEPDVRHFLELILQAHGYRVLSAGHAERALDLFGEQALAIDLLFTDIGLSRLDGFGLVTRAKVLKPGLRTLLASGYVDGNVRSRIVELGIDGFVQKPYDASSLLQMIRSVLDQGAVR
jgi:two-component system, cell cycle sensor histidine kinase and response regulator CckA